VYEARTRCSWVGEPQSPATDAGFCEGERASANGSVTQVRIKVAAAGTGFTDSFIRRVSSKRTPARRSNMKSSLAIVLSTSLR
jgi:hypothetical protein